MLETYRNIKRFREMKEMSQDEICSKLVQDIQIILRKFV